MGTPKQEKYLELKVSVAEKEQVFALARVIRERLDLGMVSTIFAEMRAVLLPLVQWLDTPLFSRSGIYRTPPFPDAYRKARAMLVLNGFEKGFLDLMLERSGFWLVKVKPSPSADPSYLERDSKELAKLVVEHSDALLRVFSPLTPGQLVGDFGFLRNAALYHAVQDMVSKCLEMVRRLIEVREKRVQLMRERLQLLENFPGALDPLLAEGKTSRIEAFSIFFKHKCSESRVTADYLSEGQLKPFWKQVNPSSRGLEDSYVPSNYKHSFSCLGDFLEYVRSALKEIQETQDLNVQGATAIWRRGSGRLPFSEDELNILRNTLFSMAPES